MSDLNNESQEELDFESWLDEGSWTYLHNGFYECAGNHVWHEDDVEKEYKKYKKTVVR